MMWVDAWILIAVCVCDSSLEELKLESDYRIYIITFGDDA